MAKPGVKRAGPRGQDGPALESRCVRPNRVLIMRPLQILFLSFLLVPLLEIFLLIKVGSLIGALPTVFLVVFTAVLGAVLIRLQGFATLQQVRRDLARGILPATALLEGLLLLVAGALLLTPGFFTDTLGFLLLVPALRRRLAAALLRRGVFMAPGAAPPPAGGPRIIEGQYHRDND